MKNIILIAKKAYFILGLLVIMPLHSGLQTARQLSSRAATAAACKFTQKPLTSRGSYNASIKSSCQTPLSQPRSYCQQRYINYTGKQNAPFNARFYSQSTSSNNQSKNYYQILGMEKNATPQEIKKAYILLAKKIHPDVNPEPGSKEKFQALQNAYETLYTPTKRAQYDESLKYSDSSKSSFYGNQYRRHSSTFDEDYYKASETRAKAARVRREEKDRAEENDRAEKLRNFRESEIRNSLEYKAYLDMFRNLREILNQDPNLKKYVEEHPLPPWQYYFNPIDRISYGKTVLGRLRILLGLDLPTDVIMKYINMHYLNNEISRIEKNMEIFGTTRLSFECYLFEKNGYPRSVVYELRKYDKLIQEVVSIGLKHPKRNFILDLIINSFPIRYKN